MKFGTQVRNPTTRAGSPRYVPCTYCGLYYTKLGISRHWDKCPKNPKRKQPMKQAICSKCGKDLKHLVPDDATDVICFACDQKEATDGRQVHDAKPR